MIASLPSHLPERVNEGCDFVNGVLNMELFQWYNLRFTLENMALPAR
jgi:hypothetical protein